MIEYGEPLPDYGITGFGQLTWWVSASIMIDGKRFNVMGRSCIDKATAKLCAAKNALRLKRFMRDKKHEIPQHH